MTNAELIQKIRAEIERQISDLPDTWSGSPAAKWAFEALLSFLSSLESEKPIQDELEKEIERCVIEPYYDLNGVAVKGATAYLTVNDVADIARHFAQWGAEHTPLPEDTVLFNKGVAEGKRLMMEDAVEGEITKDNRGNNVIRAGLLNNGFEIGDKVHIIVKD